MSHTAIVPDHAALRNYLFQHRLPLYFSKPVLAHIETYMAAATAKGFRGKVVDLAEYSDCHRTTLGHFLAEGKWDEGVLQAKVKIESLRQVVQESKRTGLTALGMLPKTGAASVGAVVGMRDSFRGDEAALERWMKRFKDPGMRRKAILELKQGIGLTREPTSAQSEQWFARLTQSGERSSEEQADEAWSEFWERYNEQQAANDQFWFGMVALADAMMSIRDVKNASRYGTMGLTSGGGTPPRPNANVSSPSKNSGSNPPAAPKAKPEEPSTGAGNGKKDGGNSGKGGEGSKGSGCERTGKAPDMGSIVKEGNKTKYTNPAGNELTWFDQHPKNSSRDIETFLNSPNIGKATEGKVAKFVSEQKEVTGFGQKVKRADKTPVGDFDVLTKDEIIEVKASAGALKVDQIEKYTKTTHKDFLNPENKRVIVYIEEPLVNLAPEQLQKLNKIKNMGAIVVNSLEELKGVLK